MGEVVGMSCSGSTGNDLLREFLEDKSAEKVLGNFLGTPILDDPSGRLDDAAIISIDMEWWQYNSKPVTEIGISELKNKFPSPNVHAHDILAGVQTAHARIIPHAHLRNTFRGAGDPEKFELGTTKFVTKDQAKQVLDTFVRQDQQAPAYLQPIILVGHAVDNDFEHILSEFDIDLLSYGSIVKVIDTQVMASAASITGPNGYRISLTGLLKHFNLTIPNLHSVANDAAGTLMAAVLLALKTTLYPGAGPFKPPAVVDGNDVQEIISTLLTDHKSPEPVWGMKVLCTRCERNSHLRAECFAKVQCKICRGSGVWRLSNDSRTHKASRCLFQHQALPPPDPVLDAKDFWPLVPGGW